MEVPEIVLVFPSFQAEVMSTPGANISTEEPKLEKSAIVSSKAEAPTVMTSSTRAGEVLLASWPSFPAATTVVTPAA